MWEEVRRALGRLASRTGTRALPLEKLAVRARVEGECFGPPAVPNGAAEGQWRPQADVRRWPSPEAMAGAGNADLASVATVISGNAALRPNAVRVLGPVAAVQPRPVNVWNLPGAAVGTPPIQRTALAYPGSVRPAAAVLKEPPVRRMIFDAPRTSVIRWPRGEGPLPLRGGNVKSSLAAVARLPLTRRRLSDAFVDPAQAKAQLAAVSGSPEAEVALIGVFPDVPLASVERLALAEGGAGLRVWLKPDALGPHRGHGPKLITVVLGRHRVTGKMLQAVLAAPPGGGR